MIESYEVGNRRAEVNTDTGHVAFFLLSRKRRAKKGVWFNECEDVAHARRLAVKWTRKTRLN